MQKRKRRQKSVALVPCPTCGQPMGPQVAAMVQHAGGKRRQLGVRQRQMGTRGHHFETTAPAVALQPEPKWARKEPLPQISESLSQAPLAPGEHREAKTYRARSLDDVWPPLAWSLLSGALIGVAGGIVCYALDWQWFVGVGIWFGATTICWFVSSKDLLDDDKLLTTVQEMVRAPEPQAPVVEPPSINLTFTEQRERGGGRQDRITLKAPASNAGGLAAFCDALVRGVAFPSLEGGRNGNGARSYGYTEDEFTAWRRAAIRARLLASKGAHQGYEITDRGRAAFTRIAGLELEEASYSLPQVLPHFPASRSRPEAPRGDGRTQDGR